MIEFIIDRLKRMVFGNAISYVCFIGFKYGGGLQVIQLNLLLDLDGDILRVEKAEKIWSKLALICSQLSGRSVDEVKQLFISSEVYVIIHCVSRYHRIQIEDDQVMVITVDRSVREFMLDEQLNSDKTGLILRVD